MIKKILLKYYLTLIIVLFAFSLEAQPQWIVYTPSNSGLKEGFLMDIAIDTNNVKWIATDSGVVKFNGTTWIYFNKYNSPLPENKINRVAIDKNNNVWVSVYNKCLAKYDGIQWTIYDSLFYDSLYGPIKQFLDLEVDEYNNVWATAGRGLLKYSNGLWYLYTANNSGLPGNGAVISISFEKHIKWIGTYNKGYVSFNDTNWVIYNSTNSGLPDDHTTNANYVDYQNNKWISTFMSGISMFNSKSNTWTNYDTYWPGLPDNYVDAILVQKNGLKWFGSSSGLTKYNDTNVVVYYANNFVYDVYRLKTDRYDNLWILGTYLTVHNPTGIVSINNISSIINPSQFNLYQNFPNPFNPTTTIKYSINNNNRIFYNVKVKIFDVSGKEISTIVNDFEGTGEYKVQVYMGNRASGIYFYSLIIDNKVVCSKKLMLIK
jgi:ligand-binding sensor domain-containing protein